MTRILCAWLPHWAIETHPRSKRHPSANGPEERAAPFVLVHTQASARRLYACGPQAQALGLYQGQALADAQAIIPTLRYADADLARERAMVDRLGLWALRYSPWVHSQCESQGSAELLIDIQGSEHLFGGASGLAHDLRRRLSARGIGAHIALAPTLGAAIALARFGTQGVTCLDPEDMRSGVAHLPVDSLRIGEAAGALTRAGLKTIGDVLRIARSPLAARFGTQLLSRLDQLLGLKPEPLNPLIPPLSHRAQRLFCEPLLTLEALHAQWFAALSDLTGALAARGLGARRLRLTLHRTDGGVVRAVAGCAAPSHDPQHLARLLSHRLTPGQESPDLGLGIEGLTLEAAAEPAPARQKTLDSAAGADLHEINALIDRLGSRLAYARIERLDAHATHIPEAAVIARPAPLGPAQGWEDILHPPERPLLMLPAAEPAEVIAEIPDGPPKRFRWRKTLYEAARAEGPERIAPQWWRHGTKGQATRDYYRVEDAQGRRFWLYREGLFGEQDTSPKWFVHGVFA
ncbi:MAG TPA: hypothetical protein DCL48_15870 [Alphaproteobacteria bacterium]|nr:hypothetical protein [Alphaproteobacteria bacterium]